MLFVCFEKSNYEVLITYKALYLHSSLVLVFFLIIKVVLMNLSDKNQYTHPILTYYRPVNQWAIEIKIVLSFLTIQCRGNNCNHGLIYRRLISMTNLELFIINYYFGSIY